MNEFNNTNSLLDTVMLLLLQNGIDRYAVLKGGFLLGKELGVRGTQDIDMSMGSEMAWGHVRQIFCIVGDTLVYNGHIATYEITDPNPQKRTSGRVRYFTGKGATSAGVDIWGKEYSFP